MMFNPPDHYDRLIQLQKRESEILQKKCAIAEKAAYEARPKVYRLIRRPPMIVKSNTFTNAMQNTIEDYIPVEINKQISQDNVKAQKDTPVRFFALGCQGNAKEAQTKVAESMNAIASDNTQEPPDFILILGDNFYDFGVDSPADSMFVSNFHSIYANPDFTYIKNIPCFVILGNHDENLHTLGDNIRKYSADTLSTEKGIARGLHQVAHTYLPKYPYKDTNDLQKLYQSNSMDDSIIDLEIDKLPKWNMPSRTYSLICDDYTQLFCIDSNTYVSDYLKLLNGDDHPDNQAAWLMREVTKAKKEGRKTMLALHHPLVTPGKRAFHNDIKLYLSKKEISSLTFGSCFEHLLASKGCSYNDLMNETMKQQGLIFDAIFTAHDHDIYYYNNKNDDTADYPICQVTSGGGGGDLQKREDFEKQANMACFLKRHGFTEVYCPHAGNLEFFMHTIPKSEKDDKYLLHFDSDDCNPIRSYPDEMSDDEENAIEKLCSTVNKAIDSYMAFLAPLQKQESGKFLGVTGNISHGYEGVERAHKIWAYISKYYADDYKTTIEKIYHLAKWDATFTQPSQHSLINILNYEISKSYGYGVTLKSLYNQSLQMSQSNKPKFSA